MEASFSSLLACGHAPCQESCWMSLGKTWIWAVVKASCAFPEAYPSLSPLVSKLHLCKLFLKAKICSRFASLICPEVIPLLANSAFDLQWAMQLRGGPPHGCGRAETIIYVLIILLFPLQFSEVVWERCLLDGDRVLSRWPAKMM